MAFVASQQPVAELPGLVSFLGNAGSAKGLKQRKAVCSSILCPRVSELTSGERWGSLHGASQALLTHFQCTSSPSVASRCNCRPSHNPPQWSSHDG
jgi:hypothetical protein